MTGKAGLAYEMSRDAAFCSKRSSWFFSAMFWNKHPLISFCAEKSRASPKNWRGKCLKQYHSCWWLFLENPFLSTLTKLQTYHLSSCSFSSAEHRGAHHLCEVRSKQRWASPMFWDPSENGFASSIFVFCVLHAPGMNLEWSTKKPNKCKSFAQPVLIVLLFFNIAINWLSMWVQQLLLRISGSTSSVPELSSASTSNVSWSTSESERRVSSWAESLIWDRYILPASGRSVKTGIVKRSRNWQSVRLKWKRAAQDEHLESSSNDPPTC